MALTQAEINEVMQQLQPIIAKALSESTSVAQAQANIQQGVTQYIGARYVPFFADPIEWDSTRAYEPLTIVLYQGNSFTTRQYTPAGIDINNEAFWALTGNYNAQIELYRKEAINALSLAKTNKQGIAALDAQLAGTSDSGLKTLIEQETARAIKAEQKLSKQPVDYVQPEYLGDFVSYNGKFYGDSDNQPYINQGYCVGYQGTHLFALINDDDTSALVTQVDSELTGYAQKGTAYSDWGHANCLSFNETTGHYYVYTGSNAGKLYVYDNNLTTRLASLNTPAGAYGNIAYDRATSKVWYVTYDGTIYELVNEARFELQSVKFPTLFDQQQFIGQGMACFNGLAVFPCSSGKSFGKRGFIVGDIATGDIIKNVAIASEDPAVGDYGELEDCDFSNSGTLYFSTIRNHATDAASTYCSVTYLFKCDIFGGSMGVTQRNPALDWNLDSRYTGFKSDGSEIYPFKDIAEWCLAAQTVPVAPKITKIGFRSHDAVTMNGLFFLDNARIYNLWFYGGNNVTINGGIYVRGGSVVNIVNRVQITECKDAPFTYLFRLTNSTLNCGTISLTKLTTSKITKPMLLQYVTRANIQNLLVDGSVATPDTDTLSGFGYTIGAPLTGKYVTA